MKQALEGLEEVTKVETDLPRDWFRVHLDSGWEPSREKVMATIKSLGYSPHVVTGEAFGTPASAPGDKGGMPPALQQAIERARAVGKRYVLVDVTEDG